MAQSSLSTVIVLPSPRRFSRKRLAKKMILIWGHSDSDLFTEQPKYQAKDNADDDHACDREIKPKIFSLNHDITG